MKSKFAKRNGFTLVEIALALLVVSLGMLAIFGLFPSGLDASRRAVDDTYAAFFADEVFNGFKAQIAVTPWDELDNINVRARSTHMWGLTQGQEVVPNSGWQVATYRPNDLPGGEIEFAVRYNFQVGYLATPEGARPRAYGVLQVVSGEFAATNNAIRFYTEFLNTKPAPSS
jgi:prepilin-type N-terminal cleavage/methylation domain-containing protein